MSRRDELFQDILRGNDSISLLDPCPPDLVVVELLEKVKSSVAFYPESDRKRAELIALCRLLKEATVHGRGSGTAIKFLMTQINSLLHPFA
jgi:hypothetical protein